MGLRNLRQRLANLGCRFLMVRVHKLPDRNHVAESLSRATASGWEGGRGSDSSVRTLDTANGQVTRSSESTQRKTNVAAGASAPARKHLCAGDVARGLLAANARVSISNVLVVGTDGSTPLKRMEIHLDEPELVPAVFDSLAGTLQSSGFDFRAARSPDIPVTDIWLTCPLDDPRKTLLSRAAFQTAGVEAGVTAQPGSSREQREQSPVTITMQQPLIRETRISRD
jgi:hypothetical protein